MIGVRATASLDNRSCFRVEDNQTLVAIFDPGAGHNEDQGAEFRYRDFPLPPKTTHLLISATRVDGKDGHIREVCW